MREAQDKLTAKDTEITTLKQQHKQQLMNKTAEMTEKYQVLKQEKDNNEKLIKTMQLQHMEEMEKLRQSNEDIVTQLRNEKVYTNTYLSMLHLTSYISNL